MEKKIKCPRCGKETIYSPANEFRPFCSDRCRLIDLGEWAEGKYAIPVQNNASADDDALQELDSENDGQSGQED